MSKQSLDLKVKRGSGFGCQTLRGYSLECEAKDVWVLKPKDGQQWQAIAKDCILWWAMVKLLIKKILPPIMFILNSETIEY